MIKFNLQLFGGRGSEITQENCDLLCEKGLQIVESVVQ